MQFDREAVREIMWQGMTEEEYRNAQEPIDYVARRSCVRLLWAVLVSKIGRKRHWPRRWVIKRPRQS